MNYFFTFPCGVHSINPAWVWTQIITLSLKSSKVLAQTYVKLDLRPVENLSTIS